MIKLFGILASLCLLIGCKQAQIEPYTPINLYPENPHYFIYQGKPVFLITSDQHYGAVTNMDFDYTTFLDTLAANGLNFTRIYPGAYIEKDGEYMPDNNLGARNGRQILPWARTNVTGAHEVRGGYKLDLDQWYDAYLLRLKDFISKARDRNIIVDIAFFNGMYPDRWEYQAMYHANNIQFIGNCVFNEVQTLKDSALARYHQAYVKKITEEVNEFDNVILDICDEPFQDGCLPALYNPWISKMITVIINTESSLPKKHLIVQTIDSHTRGGAAFMQLNGLYSTFNSGASGTENSKLLSQLKILKNFMLSFDFFDMLQDTSFLADGAPSGTFARAISKPGEQYAFYLHHSEYGCWFKGGTRIISTPEYNRYCTTDEKNKQKIRYLYMSEVYKFTRPV